MDIRSKLFLATLGLLTLLAVAGTFYSTVILQDFQVLETEENVSTEPEE